MKKVYVIQYGKAEIQAATGLLIFQAEAVSSLAFEDLDDAAEWIESRYGNPKQLDGQYVWILSGTDNTYAYRILFLDMASKGGQQ